MDLVIEIISEESSERDRGEKFIEYETGGVGEYRMIDYLREEALFYRLENGRFVSYSGDSQNTIGHHYFPILFST